MSHRRTSSTEMTVVRPREALPPTAAAPMAGPTIEELADRERARRDAQDAIPTMVECPACRDCPLRGEGVHMVPADVAAAWERSQKR